MKPQLLDFHSHLTSEYSIVCTDSPDLIPDDSEKKTLMRCIGLLPDKWTAEREQLLFDRLSSDADLHMGEVGLDRRFQDMLPMEQQEQILDRELSFAIENDRSVSLHCVRATGPMLDLLSKHHFRPFSIMWHGFSGSAETAASLYRLGVIISIGPRFLGRTGNADSKTKIEKILSANPMTVLETDYTGENAKEHLEILEGLYRKTQIKAENCVNALKIFRNS